MNTHYRRTTTQLLSLTLIALLITTFLHFSDQSLNLPGGKSIETDKSKIKELMEFMTVKLMETPYQAKIHQIVKVERQVVNGFNYYLTMVVISNDQSQQQEPIKQLVEAKVFESTHHAHDFELISIDKRTSPTTPQTDKVSTTASVLPGGRNKESDYLKITELVNFLQQKLLESDNQSVIRKIHSIEKQVVNGINYFIGVNLEFADGKVKVMEAMIHEPPIFVGSSNLQFKSLIEL